MPSAEHAHPRILDLDDLESDTAPLFVIKTDDIALEFEPLFYNASFRQLRLQSSILAQNKAALLFRSWAQALGDFKPEHEFSDRTWSAELAGRNGGWKVVKAKSKEYKEREQLDQMPEDTTIDHNGRTPILTRSKTECLRGFRHDAKISLKDISHTNLHARWESIQTMMEMSDVGVFEYNSQGKLLHANKAWYRLSSLAGEGDHPEFSFMDLVYPEDQALVMSMWNKLSLGKSVTFEMRWKPRPGSNDVAQWVLSACVPVFDDDKNLIGIAGNTIDINAQKRSQAVAQAQVEALEQARLAEMKFARFAQVSPVAIYIYVPESGMNFVNDQFFELTGHAHAPVNQFEWFDLISEEDVERVKHDWESMLRGDKTAPVQFRLKKTWVNQDGKRSNIWVQSSSYPELDENGRNSMLTYLGIMGTLFDISQFKWAESVQRRRIEEAWEAKRQQENFIDMTSHELRNPLSAVIQCADSVIASLHHISRPQLEALHPSHDLSKAESEIQSCLESLQIIVSCSMHQKRVIDDVLTLSKLDSNLILITPMRVQPAVVVSDAVKMFEVECNQAGIQLDFKLDETFSGMEWTMLDPSRLLQVLINLLTNAIKFTKDRPAKSIKVTLGGSWSRPPKCWQDINFTDNEVSDVNVTDKPEWGDGKLAYLWLKVQDTGCGMTTDEQKKLFSRFSQATPRTHVKYGGSGLGLFISKSLTKLQGGSIGVNSVKGEGSTFAFYVSTRLAYPPADKVEARAVQARPVPHRTMTGEEAMQRIKLNVLIVEDNLVNQKVLKKQLLKFGWNISVAGNGQEALDWLKNSVYWHNEMDDSTANKDKHELDIILMDIEMPIMDGLTCARLIRDYEHQGLLADPCPGASANRRPSAKSISPIRTQEEDQKLPDSQIVQSPTSTSHERADKGSLRLPILAVSANARMEQIEQALSAGMDDAIAKPFRIPELWPKIRSLVKRVALVDTRAKVL
ncbi:histidine kinase hhk13p [Pyrenophora seminiperda CCB06]|uniref:Histidine kinase hhk13p n=1 Tax=Pyrenophora seminiperda CCB06 TaxID=1302712 RepID=A0A3M7MFY1_9PLEO|nr:histidine kinase hhk13p [Pyrenophora seminiperda CCB06]